MSADHGKRLLGIETRRPKCEDGDAVIPSWHQHIHQTGNLPEIMNLSDRILVTRQGREVEEFTVRRATEERIMYAAVH